MEIIHYLPLTKTIDDIEDPLDGQITIYAGRGLLVESTNGPIWMYGTAVEHHALYQYQVVGASNIFMGQIQTETAYYQPNPSAPIPFPIQTSWSDPIFQGELHSGWGLRVVNSTNTFVYGAGMYSFFSNNDLNCSNQGNGEACQLQIFSTEGTSGIGVYNLNTIGTVNMWTNNGVDEAVFSDNLDGFVDTIAMIRV
jgi:glucan 1,3-beta-glucosidase